MLATTCPTIPHTNCQAMHKFVQNAACSLRRAHRAETGAMRPSCKSRCPLAHACMCATVRLRLILNPYCACLLLAVLQQGWEATHQDLPAPEADHTMQAGALACQSDTPADAPAAAFAGAGYGYGAGFKKKGRLTRGSELSGYGSTAATTAAAASTGVDPSAGGLVWVPDSCWETA